MDSSLEPLEEVFGAASHGATPIERARSSSRVFVRSQHQLTFYDEGASGRQLNAYEALREFGWEKLRELADRPAVPILRNADEPYRTLERRLQDLGLTLERVARRLGWDAALVREFGQRAQIPFRKLEQLAQVLALDEQKLGVVPGALGDGGLGVRLREMQGGEASKLSEGTVLGLSEAAWVIRKQLELAAAVDSSIADRVQRLGFRPSDDYGSPHFPAWRVGYELAARARDLLGIGRNEPIRSLKELIEHRLGIPVVQMELPPSFAGATVANGSNRGIVVNLKGLNQNVWVRRMTLAHELGHLLWDPDYRLQKLVVDRYDEIDRYADVGRAPRSNRDFVEMRANGFAVEFLASREGACREYESVGGGSAGVERVMSKYGISKTSATFHLENAYDRKVDLSAFRLASHRGEKNIHIEPSDDWIAGEDLAIDFFKPESVPISRRGRFAAFVAREVKLGLCSKDSAAALLRCSPREIDTALAFVDALIDQEPSFI